MSIYSRDYMREDPRSRRGKWSIVTWLLLINIAVYVIDLLMSGRLQDWFGLSLAGLAQGKIWTPVTYQFVHSSPMHIIFNMVGVFFFGRNLLHLAGPQHVLRLYLLGGVAGGALQLIYSFVMADNAHIVGASGSVLALLFAMINLLPSHPLRLIFPPVTITPRTIGIIVIVINCITLLMSLVAPNPDRPQTAVMAHFGGMLLGWLYVKRGYHRGVAKKSSSPKSGSREKKFGFITIRRVDDDSEEEEKVPTRSKPFVTDDIDAILDKINEHGFQSLTKAEKKLLDRSSQKLSKRLDKDS